MTTKSVNLTVEVNSSTVATEEDSNVFYYANGTPITYMYFSLNLVIIVFHIITVTINSIMIEAIRRSRKTDEPGGHCMIGLSASYIWHGLMMIYTGIYGLANMQEKNECLLRFGLTHSSFILISWSNCLLTFDRYIQIEFPFWHKRNVQVTTIWIGNLLAAIGAIFFGLSPLIFSWYHPQDFRNNVCEYFHILPVQYLQMFYGITFTGFPIFIFTYTKLLLIARNHKLSLKKMARYSVATNARASRRKKKWRPVKMVLIICSVYFCCWAPPGIFGFYVTSNQSSLMISWVNYLSVMAGLIMVPSISAITSPCLFTLHKEVKARFLELVKFRKYSVYSQQSSYIGKFGQISKSNTKDSLYIRSTEISRSSEPKNSMDCIEELGDEINIKVVVTESEECELSIKAELTSDGS